MNIAIQYEIEKAIESNFNLTKIWFDINRFKKI